MTTPSLRVLRLDPEVPLPHRAHTDDAGLDISAREDVLLAPGQRALVPTGIALAVPTGYAVFIHPRSGLAARHGITVVNAPGTIDSGYRGEVMVCLLNTDPTQSVSLKRGDKIAQLVVQQVELTPVVEVTDAADFHDSERGIGGFGSTGGVAHWSGTGERSR